MRVVFMGTPHFASTVLEALADNHDVVAAYTRPDAVSGRGSRVRPTPVKESALARGIPVEQPKTLRDPDVQASLRALRPDVLVVAAYGLILPREVLDAARFGAINVHGSLLPRWRGAAPVQRAILAGDETTGVAIMRMEEGLDTGPFCATACVPIDDKNAQELTDELARIGAKLLLEALPGIESGSCEWTEQDESLATYAEKVTRADVAIDATVPVDQAARRVRASSPQAPTRVVVAGKPATLLRAHRSSTPVEPGAVSLDRDGLVLGFSDGGMAVEIVKPDGKREMSATDWARGLHLAPDTRWETHT